MSQSFILSLLVASASVVNARHIHLKAGHQHEERQAVPALSPPAVATPVAAPAPASNNQLSSLASQLETCLNSLPNDVTALLSAVDQRLADVQSQVNSILNGNLPSTSVPIVNPTLPPYLATPPALSAPALSTPAVSAPAVSAPAVPSISVPALPSISVPSVSVPAISLPSISVPGVSAPSVAAPSVSAPGVPSVSLPSVAVPTVPSVSVPAFSLPSPNLPTTAVPPFSLPLFSPALPTVNFQPPAVTSVSAPSVQVPALSTPGVPAATLPSVAAPSVPSVAAPSVALPSLGAGSVVSPAAPTVPSVSLPASPSVPAAQLTSRVAGASTIVQGLLSLTTRVSVPVSAPTAIPTQFFNTIPQNFITVSDMLTSSRSAPVNLPTPYVFNANARDNLAVYYGNTPATSAGGLAQLCANHNVDIVIISFVYDFFTANGYPSIFFGTTSCIGQTAAQAQRAPGLKDCSELAQQITFCQAVGKKVLVSLGGYIANSTFASDLEARTFALTLWNLFGAGTTDSDLRPFGKNVIIDGFDIDNEDGLVAHWDTFTRSMRALFNSDATKTYYLSAAPQCPYPDSSIPISAMEYVDFVWTQFYNNPSCNLDSAGFQSSFATWSTSLASTDLPTGPKLYIGAAAFPEAGSGYVDSSGLSSRISLAKELFRSNLGGMALWDGSEALQNTDQFGHSYLDYAKWSLQY